jgi:predicted O-methyltransferase YrrM
VRAAVAQVLRRSRGLGYLGPGPVEDHITHALGFAAQLSSGPTRAVDLGSGGGVPGLVLAALAWPATHWTLLDATARRCVFLASAVAELGLADRVTVTRGRGEQPTSWWPVPSLLRRSPQSARRPCWRSAGISS